jgi:hypothetical protein
MNNEVKIEKLDVKKPRDDEQNRKDALMKKIADRIAYIWWMTGSGTIDSFWEQDSFYLDFIGAGTEKGCFRFMNFKIVDSEYLPEKMPTTFELNEYMKTHDYKVVTTDGEKKVMTYFDYLVFSGGDFSGGHLLMPMQFQVGNTYSINIVQGGLLNKIPSIAEQSKEFLYKEITYADEDIVLLFSNKESFSNTCAEIVAGKMSGVKTEDECSTYTQSECINNHRGQCYWDGFWDQSCSSCVTEIQTCDDYIGAWTGFATLTSVIVAIPGGFAFYAPIGAGVADNYVNCLSNPCQVPGDCELGVYESVKGNFCIPTD